MLLSLLHTIALHLLLTQSVGGTLEPRDQTHCSTSQITSARFIEDCKAILEQFIPFRRKSVFHINDWRIDFVINSCQFTVHCRVDGQPSRPWEMLFKPALERVYDACVWEQGVSGGWVTGRVGSDGFSISYSGELSEAPSPFTAHSDDDDDDDNDESAALLGGRPGLDLDGPSGSSIEETLEAAGDGSTPNDTLWDIENQAIPHGPSAPALETAGSLATPSSGTAQESSSAVEPPAPASTAATCYSAWVKCARCVQDATARIRVNPHRYLWGCVKEVCKYAIGGAVGLGMSKLGQGSC